MIEPIELSYALFLLPAGRVAFRRWRWELWHGPRLLAAGWRLNPLHAQRALRVHALRYAHRRHGLHLLHPDAGAATGPEVVWPSSSITVGAGDVRVVLRPREAPEAVEVSARSLSA
jgi:hypothetical protein